MKTVENEFTRYAGQADVAQHHVWPERRHGPDRVGARKREFDGIAERCQDVVQHRRDLRLVVYDEDSAGHAACLDLIARQPARKRRPRATAAAAPIRSTLDLNRVAAYAAMKERCQSGVIGSRSSSVGDRLETNRAPDLIPHLCARSLRQAGDRNYRAVLGTARCLTSRRLFSGRRKLTSGVPRVVALGGRTRLHYLLLASAFGLTRVASRPP